MVIEIVCSVCGASLYSGFELKPTKEILNSKNGKFRCKHCGTILSIHDFALEIFKAL
ncbi:MAG: hypothetical protein QXJ86_01475 [Nitrososphaerales archaeon]